MHSRIQIGVAAGLALGLSACGTLYTLDVTAYNNPNVELGKSYVILSGNPDVGVNSPEFLEYASQVERALAPKGYRRVGEKALTEAALGIYVAVDMGDPSKRYHSVSTAVYEQPFGDGSQDIDRSSGGSAGGSGGGQSAQPSVPAAVEASEFLTGYEETGFATTVYTKHLNLVAVDLQKYIRDINSVGRADAVPKEIWSVDVETTGQPDDLHEVFPVMIAAAQPYLADSTRDVVQVKISESDKRVNAIKRGD